MAARRKSRGPVEQPKRRSLRLAKGSFRDYQKSSALDMVTPRTLFRKVLQTQPVVSPLVPEKTDSPKPVETVFQFPSVFPSRKANDSDLDISLTVPIPEETFRPNLLKRGNSKKVRLSEFERAVDKHLPSTTATSFLDNTSLTRSLQVTLGTPVTPTPDLKRGLIRRRKSFKGINLTTFEGGMEQNLMQIKDSKNHHVDLQVSVLSDASANTELFVQPQLSGQSRVGVPVLPSQPTSPRKSLSQRTVLSSAKDLKTPQQCAESDIDADMTSQDQEDILMPRTEYIDGTEGMPEGKVGSPREEQQESELADEGGMIGNNLKETLTPGTEQTTEMDIVPQQRTLSLGRKHQEGLHGDYLMELQEGLRGDLLMEPEESLHGHHLMKLQEGLHEDPLMELQEGLHGDLLMEPEESLHGHHLMEFQEGLHEDHLMELQESLPRNRLIELQESLHGHHLMEVHSSPGEHLLSDISTPVDTELPASPAGGLHAFLQYKPAKHSVKEMVEHIIEELDRTITPHVVDQGASEADLEEEPSSSKGATRLSQRTEARTPKRSVSRPEAEQLESETVGEGIQQSAGGSKPREASDLESEADLLSDIESEVEDVSEAGTDSENNEPPVKTPAFVRAKAFQCSPLLSSPRTLNAAASKPASEELPKDQVPRESKKARREKKCQLGLSSSWVKKMFSHYARMPVAKDAFQAVERCVSMYFKRLCDDLEAYTDHARRKTVLLADMELLMRRQGLVTDKIPLNVLIEHHLPLEYRKLLIPVATSGNKVVPHNIR
ncbi:centromere protein T [Sphaerodactylus townsendi]|uniref:Uncharacterized protein n=1 Tax=Sphaerodactylus townsendi TaxID=933632 RepID=A0ACB8EAN6_9SAUR|nr:centromere protein T [Sphaerodactylus townsendi]